MENVKNVAQYIFDAYKKRSGNVIDEMKLHKLLYFVQRESFAILGKPMFEEPFQGWKYGPVCPVVRASYSSDGIKGMTSGVSNQNAYIIRNIVEQYGSIESWKLSDITHRELSWQNSRIGLEPDENGCDELSLTDIRKDAEKVRPYDSVWDMYYDEFEDAADNDR